AGVDQDARALAEEEPRVEPLDRVRQQRDAAAHRWEPEGAGNDALPGALGRDPLHEEARREERLTEQYDAEPHVILGHGATTSRVPGASVGDESPARRG